MAKFTEQSFTNWIKPPSETEETKLENSERMVRAAISSDEKLKQKLTETFGQGSYANNTNVRLNSDIDINVRYTGGFYFDLPNGKTRDDFGFTYITYTFSEFKDDVENALVKKFGRTDVKRKDKCITIIGNSYRIVTDVLPTWNYRRYSENGSYILGAKFFTDDGNKEVVNFPKQHIQNGIVKNNNTYRRYKRLTRLHRKLRFKMIEDGENVSDTITSFLIECLIWNVPNNIFNNYDNWTERLKQSIIFLYEKTTTEQTCKEWGEVSQLLYLFHSSRKWTSEDVNRYMVKLWNYLEF